MPNRYNPHGFILYSIEKPIWLHDYFTKWEIRELRKEPP